VSMQHDISFCPMVLPGSSATDRQTDRQTVRQIDHAAVASIAIAIEHH